MMLLQDTLNQAILKLLVDSALSATSVSKRLGEPHLKVWRRLQQLRAQGLIEEAGSVKKRNLEVKLYRAAAAKYLPRGAMDLEPSDHKLKEAYDLYRKIASEILYSISEYSPIPSGVNPRDFCVATEIYVNAKVLTRADTQEKLRRIIQILEGSPLLGYMAPHDVWGGSSQGIGDPQ